MPIEDRRIVFTPEEAYKAIYSLCVKKEMKKPPPGTITSITEDGEDGDGKYIFQIDNIHENSGREIKYSAEFIMAALMLYCRSCHIPLPKAGKKSVLLNGDKIMLRVVI